MLFRQMVTITASKSIDIDTKFFGLRSKKMDYLDFCADVRVIYPTPFLASSMRVRILGLSSLAAIQER